MPVGKPTNPDPKYCSGPLFGGAFRIRVGPGFCLVDSVPDYKPELDQWTQDQIREAINVFVGSKDLDFDGPRLKDGDATFTLWPVDDPAGARKRFVELTIHGDVSEIVLLFADRSNKTRWVEQLSNARDLEQRLSDVIAFLSGKASL